MKRNHKNQKELKEIQALRRENAKLKKQISKLRRVITKIDLDQHAFVKDLLVSQENEDGKHEEITTRLEKENKWLCHDCEKGVLRIIVVNRRDGTFYFRKCDCCSKRTKMKKFTEEVEGV